MRRVVVQSKKRTGLMLRLYKCKFTCFKESYLTQTLGSVGHSTFSPPSASQSTSSSEALTPTKRQSEFFELRAQKPSPPPSASQSSSSSSSFRKSPPEGNAIHLPQAQQDDFPSGFRETLEEGSSSHARPKRTHGMGHLRRCP